MIGILYFVLYIDNAKIMKNTTTVLFCAQFIFQCSVLRYFLSFSFNHCIVSPATVLRASNNSIGIFKLVCPATVLRVSNNSFGIFKLFCPVTVLRSSNNSFGIFKIVCPVTALGILTTPLAYLNLSVL